LSCFVELLETRAFLKPYLSFIFFYRKEVRRKVRYTFELSISDSSIQAFWTLTADEQKQLWGTAIDVSRAVTERFNQYL